MFKLNVAYSFSALDSPCSNRKSDIPNASVLELAKLMAAEMRMHSADLLRDVTPKQIVLGKLSPLVLRPPNQERIHWPFGDELLLQIESGRTVVSGASVRDLWEFCVNHSEPASPINCAERCLTAA